MEISMHELRQMICSVMEAQKNVLDNENIDVEEVLNYDENKDLQAIGFDSLCYISLIVMIEEKYQVEFADSSLALVNMNSIYRIKNEVDAMLKNIA